MATIGVLIYMSADMFSQFKKDNMDILAKITKAGEFDTQCFRCSDIYQDIYKIIQKETNSVMNVTNNDVIVEINNKEKGSYVD